MLHRFLVVLSCAASAFAQLSPEETLARLKVADGLEVTLFAAEPDLWNPTTIDIDAQGRVWVCEARNYRLFNQPITEKAGDRIRVLEDTDGDGRCDKATTFYQDETLQAPMGIAVLGDRVYICQAPDLFYLEDTDKDGVADKRTVVLTGFDGVDHDHAIHGVSFGPDGLLYFSSGDRGLNVTDKSGNRVHVGKDAPHTAASVLRCDLDGNHLELLAEGMRNPYEPAVDPWGNVFISDNDDDGNEQCRVNYVVEGGNYGYWPRRKGDRRLDAVHWNSDQPGVMPTMVKTGFGSPTGLMFYEGSLLPERYRGTVIHSDAGPRVIRSYRPEAKGAGFTSGIDVLVSCEEDSWFRPSDVCAAPDGSIFIADWYDPGVGGHRMGDVARGRIYRLAPKGSASALPALDLESDEGIIAAFVSPNQARRYLAYKILEDRIRASNTSPLDRIATSANPMDRARAAWLLAQHPTEGDGLVQSMLKDPMPAMRVEAVRALARMGKTDALLGAVGDADPQVRRQVALSLGASSDDARVAKALITLAEAYDGHDRFYREALGIAFRGKESWAFNEVIARLGNRWDTRLAGLVIQLHPPDALPLAAAALADGKLDIELRILALDAIDAIGTKEAGQRILAALTGNTPIELRKHALHLLARDEGDRWRAVTEAEGLLSYLESAIADPAQRGAALAYIADTRFTPALGNVVASATDTSATPETRAQALAALQLLAPRASRNDTAAHLDTVLKLVTDGDASIQSAAVKALGAFKGDAAMSALRSVLVTNGTPVELRREVMHSLAGSKSGSTVLIELAEKGELPQELLLDATETLHSSPHENVRLMAEKVLPRATTREGSALPPLSEMLKMAGDPVRGKAVFFSPDRAQCHRCHVVNGEGKLVGPDLSKIGQKASKENLYESILNPSAAVSPEYKVWILSTFEEGALSGFIRAESAQSVELMDSAGTVVSLKPDDILERTASSASLMPNGLTAALSAQELADLVAYMLTLK